MARWFFLAAGIFGFLGVAGGAFGAHALKTVVAADQLNIFETGIRYQMYHAFALALAGWGLKEYGTPSFRYAGWMFIIGVALFSGSLYIMTFTGMKWFGVITPFGGVSFLGGWLMFIRGFWKTP